MSGATIGTGVAGLAIGLALGAFLFQGAPASVSVAGGGTKIKGAHILVKENTTGTGCTAEFRKPEHKQPGKGVKILRDELGLTWQIKNQNCVTGSWDVQIKKKSPASGNNKPLPDECEQTVAVPSDTGEASDPAPACTFPVGNTDIHYEYTLSLCARGTSNCTEADPELDVRRR